MNRNLYEVTTAFSFDNPTKEAVELLEEFITNEVLVEDPDEDVLSVTKQVVAHSPEDAKARVREYITGTVGLVGVDSVYLIDATAEERP